MSEQARLQYESLLKEGELKNMFPFMTGKWEKDCDKFIKQYEDNKTLLNMDVIIEDEDEYINFEEGEYGI